MCVPGGGGGGGMEGREKRENLREVLRLGRPWHLLGTKMGTTWLNEEGKAEELRSEMEGNITRQGLCKP